MKVPNRQNRLQYMPSTIQHFPNFVVEIAYRNESPDRLVAGTNNKYFTATTSVQVQLGIEIFGNKNPANRQFWGIWGVRSLFGVGMVHRETTVDADGNEPSLDVQSAIPLCRPVHHSLELHLLSSYCASNCSCQSHHSLGDHSIGYSTINNDIKECSIVRDGGISCFFIHFKFSFWVSAAHKVMVRCLIGMTHK